MEQKEAENWVSACLKKKKLKEAWADSVVKRAIEGGGYLRKYHCPHCFAWHVTSKRPYGKFSEEKAAA